MKTSDRVAKLIFVLAILSAHAIVLAQPTAFAVNSRGFLAEEDIHVLWRVDLSNGQVERVGQTSFLDMEGLALSPDGTLYGADDESKTLVTVNTNSGFSSPVGNFRNNMGVSLASPKDFGMTFTCSGQLLVSSDTDRSLYVASLETGSLQRIGEAGALGAPITDLASWGDTLYGIGQGLAGNDGQFMTDSPNLYRIDPEIATAELVGSLGQAVLPYANAGLAFDDDGILWAVTDRRSDGVPDIRSEIFRIDTETGAAEKTADAELVGFESLAIAPPGGCDTPGSINPAKPVPASNTVSLMILAFLMLMACWWTLHVRQR